MSYKMPVKTNTEPAKVRWFDGIYGPKTQVFKRYNNLGWDISNSVANDVVDCDLNVEAGSARLRPGMTKLDYNGSTTGFNSIFQCTLGGRNVYGTIGSDGALDLTDTWRWYWMQLYHSCAVGTWSKSLKACVDIDLPVSLARPNSADITTDFYNSLDEKTSTASYTFTVVHGTSIAGEGLILSAESEDAYSVPAVSAGGSNSTKAYLYSVVAPDNVIVDGTEYTTNLPVTEWYVGSFYAYTSDTIKTQSEPMLANNFTTADGDTYATVEFRFPMAGGGYMIMTGTFRQV